MTRPQFTIIVPAYNEEGAILQVLGVLTDLYRDCAEIIVVDDGSTDGTAELVSSVPSVRLVSHRRNFGYGASIKTGVYSATTDIVCFFDGDGQHDPLMVGKLADAIEDADMVVASRGISAFKHVLRAPGKFVLHMLANFLTGRRIPDLNSGLRIVRREMMLRYLHLLPNGFSASTTMTMIALSQDYEVKYIPTTARPRKGKSQVKQLRDGFGTIMLILRMLLLFNPMKFFAPFSALLVMSGAIYGAYKLHQIGTGLSVGSLLLILSGMVSFIFGLVCDQISKLRLEEYEHLDSVKRFQKVPSAGGRREAAVSMESLSRRSRHNNQDT